MIKKIQSTDGRRLFKIVFKTDSDSLKHVSSTLVDLEPGEIFAALDMFSKL